MHGLDNYQKIAIGYLAAAEYSATARDRVALRKIAMISLRRSRDFGQKRSLMSIAHSDMFPLQELVKSSERRLPVTNWLAEVRRIRRPPKGRGKRAWRKGSAKGAWRGKSA